VFGWCFEEASRDHLAVILSKFLVQLATELAPVLFKPYLALTCLPSVSIVTGADRPQESLDEQGGSSKNLILQKRPINESIGYKAVFHKVSSFSSFPRIPIKS